MISAVWQYRGDDRGCTCAFAMSHLDMSAAVDFRDWGRYFEDSRR